MVTLLQFPADPTPLPSSTCLPRSVPPRCSPLASAREAALHLRRFLVPLPVALLLVLVPVLADGAVSEAESVAGLAARADLGVLGSVIAIRSAWNEDRSLIVSYVTVRVSETLLGTDPRAEVIVRVAGGVLPAEDIGMTVSGAPEFQVGEEVVVLLRGGVAPGRLEREAVGVPPFYRVVGGELGKFTLVQDLQTPSKQAVRRLAAVVGQTAGTAQSMSLDVLRALIQTAGSRRDQ